MEAIDEIVLDRDTVATPSALDVAYTRGIRVVYKKEITTPSQWKNAAQWKKGAGNQPLSSSTSSPPAISNLSDGDYLMQIRGGRVRLFQIRDGGVFPLS